MPGESTNQPAGGNDFRELVSLPPTSCYLKRIPTTQGNQCRSRKVRSDEQQPSCIRCLLAKCPCVTTHPKRPHEASAHLRTRAGTVPIDVSPDTTGQNGSPNRSQQGYAHSASVETQTAADASVNSHQVRTHSAHTKSEMDIPLQISLPALPERWGRHLTNFFTSIDPLVHIIERSDILQTAETMEASGNPEQRPARDRPIMACVYACIAITADKEGRPEFRQDHLQAAC